MEVIEQRFEHLQTLELRRSNLSGTNGFDPILGPPFVPTEYHMNMAPDPQTQPRITWSVPSTNYGYVLIGPTTDFLHNSRFWVGNVDDITQATSYYVPENTPGVYIIKGFAFIWGRTVINEADPTLSAQAGWPVPVGFAGQIPVGAGPGDYTNFIFNSYDTFMLLDFRLWRSTSPFSTLDPMDVTGGLLVNTYLGTERNATDTTIPAPTLYYRMIGRMQDTNGDTFPFPYDINPHVDAQSAYPGTVDVFRPMPSSLGNALYQIYSIEYTTDGLPVICGFFNRTINFGDGLIDLGNGYSGADVAFLAKYNPDGSVFWHLIFKGSGGPGTARIQIKQLVMDSSNSIYIIGTVKSDAFTGAGIDFGNGQVVTPTGSASLCMFAAKFSPGSQGTPGVCQWAKPFLQAANASGWSIRITSAGKLIVSGIFQGSVEFEPGSGNIGTPALNVAIARLNATTGSSIGEWVISHGRLDSSNNPSITEPCLALDSSDNVFLLVNVSGAYANLGGGATSSMTLVKYNGTTGAYVWQYGVNFLSACNCLSPGALCIDPATQNLVLTCIYAQPTDFGGGTRQLNAAPTCAIVGVSPSGTYLWDRTFGGNSTGGVDSDAPGAVRIKNGTLIWAGSIVGSIRIGSFPQNPTVFSTGYMVIAYKISGNSAPTYGVEYGYGWAYHGANVTSGRSRSIGFSPISNKVAVGTADGSILSGYPDMVGSYTITENMFWWATFNY